MNTDEDCQVTNCANDVTHEIAVRCRRGCNGEGFFSRFCAEHYRDDLVHRRWWCKKCGSDVEVFRAREVLSS